MRPGPYPAAAVEHTAEQPHRDRLQRVGGLGRRSGTGTPPTGNEQRTVGLHRHHHRVGDRQQRRGVDDHDVGAVAQALQQIRHRLRAEQLTRVGRHGAGRQHQQRLLPPWLYDIADAHLTEQHLGQPGGGFQPELPGHPWRAQVGVDQQHPPAGFGQRDGEVAGEAGASLPRTGAADRDDPGRFGDVDEAQVGAELAHRLAAGRSPGATGDQGRRAGGGLVRDLAQHRGAGDAAQGAGVADAGVGHAPQQRQEQPGQQTGECGEADVAYGAGRDGRGAGGRAVDDLDGARRRPARAGFHLADQAGQPGGDHLGDAQHLFGPGPGDDHSQHHGGGVGPDPQLLPQRRHGRLSPDVAGDLAQSPVAGHQPRVGADPLIEQVLWRGLPGGAGHGGDVEGHAGLVPGLGPQRVQRRATRGEQDSDQHQPQVAAHQAQKGHHTGPLVVDSGIAPHQVLHSTRPYAGPAGRPAAKNDRAQRCSSPPGRAR